REPPRRSAAPKRHDKRSNPAVRAQVLPSQRIPTTVGGTLGHTGRGLGAQSSNSDKNQLARKAASGLQCYSFADPDRLIENHLMAQSSAPAGPPLPPFVLGGFLAAVAAVVLMAVVSYQAQMSSNAAADAVTQGVDLVVQIQNLLSAAKDAETGQRGFLLTSDEAYLEPYT